ncbi:endo alpha-1,4 polygalactosaminidase [Aspergillus californicus]
MSQSSITGWKQVLQFAGILSAITTTAGSPIPDKTCLNNRASIWQPPAGTSWQIVLSSALTDTTPDVEIFDIDLFDNTKETITELHTLGKKVICYFSAGTYEDWRADESAFLESDLGANLDDWEGERWLDLASDNVRSIMASRLDVAVQKGCDGVDPDNVDAYDNDNGGIGMTEDNSIDFVNWLAGEAHTRGLSIGLKNAGAIIPDVIENMQWSVNEQCVEYDECDTYATFVEADKPVFHIEYPKGEDTNNQKDVSASVEEGNCDGFGQSGLFSTLLKNMILDDWYQGCQ